MADTNQNRREFLGGMLGFCAAAPLLFETLGRNAGERKAYFPIRKRLTNPYTENGKAVVVVVRGTDFAAMLARGMALLGGFAAFGTAKSVIVKPNFVFNKRTVFPTTSDESSVLTTVQYLQKEGFRHITVADRRANRENGRAGGKFAWSGLNDKAEAGGFKTDSLMDDSRAESVQVRDSRWQTMKEIGVIKTIYDADLIINMPTLKRHTMTNLTCSLKNMMGVLDVPSTENMHLWGEANKAAHDALGRDELDRRLCLAIAEAAHAVSPEMTIIDARRILCRDHLSIQSGLPRDANRLIISGDSVAADVVATRILKEIYESYDPGFTRDTFKTASHLGLGISDPDLFVLKEVSIF